MIQKNFDLLIQQAQNCAECSGELPEGPRPVFQISRNSKILIAGQAPGIKVHRSGKPFDDASGVRLREWLGIDADTFYDPQKIAILPMGFCYPGTGKSGDLPPLKKCADLWRKSFLDSLQNLELTVVIGKYALDWHLKEKLKKNLTETVKAWKEYAPEAIPLPHPSPRNNIWLKKNSWFSTEVLPDLKVKVNNILSPTSPAQSS